jgi:hypothetical protein
MLDANANLVAERDDLTIAWVNLLIEDGEVDRAETLLRARSFQPWEGGEGLVISAWEAVKIEQFHRSLSHGDGVNARRHLHEAINYPESLGEGRHPLSNRAQLQWLTGLSERAVGHDELAIAAWTTAADNPGDFTGMAFQEFSDQTQWSIRALTALGRVEESLALTQQLEEHAMNLIATPARIDFFATSLPSLLTFHDDPTATRHAQGRLMLEQVTALRSTFALQMP